MYKVLFTYGVCIGLKERHLRRKRERKIKLVVVTSFILFIRLGEERKISILQKDLEQRCTGKPRLQLIVS